MNFEKEFKDYATKHMNINSNVVDNIMSHQVEASLTPYILEERQMNVTQLDVFSRLMKDRILFLSGVVNDRMSSVVNAQLLFLDSIEKKDISIYLSSPGGSVLSGLSMVDVMDYIPSDVATINLGLAASMGSVLLGAGTKGKRSCLKYSKVMIHQVSSGTSGHVADNRISQMESEKYNFLLFKILAKNCGKSFDEMLELARRDKWFNSSEALELGIVDEIIGVNKPEDSIVSLLDGFDNYYNKEVLGK